MTTQDAKLSYEQKVVRSTSHVNDVCECHDVSSDLERNVTPGAVFTSAAHQHTSSDGGNFHSRC